MRLLGVDERGQPKWAGSEAAITPPASPGEGEWSIETFRAGKIAYAVCVAFATGLWVAHVLSI